MGRPLLTRKYSKMLMLLESVNVIAFLFPRVLPFKMLIKVYPCVFCCPKQKKLLFGSLTGTSGLKTKLTSQTVLPPPKASFVRRQKP
jgi:hypothetical protein